MTLYLDGALVFWPWVEMGPKRSHKNRRAGIKTNKNEARGCFG
jgi:hypothetical protein